MKKKGLQEKLRGLLKYKYAVAVVLLGILLMLLPADGKESRGAETEKATMPEAFDRASVQQEMERILSSIDGVGRLRLMLTVGASAEQELAQDETLSREGTSGAPEKYERTRETLRLGSGSGKQETVVTRSIYPDYVGALVVCEGGDSASVRLRVTEALSVLTGLSSEHISVISGKP